MKRFNFLSVWTALILGLPCCAPAGDWHEFWAQFELDRKRNEVWPLPFNQADQQSVRSIFGSMVQTGWEQQVVFHDFHFDRETHKLNAMGRQKLQWVLQSVPPERASLFLASGLDQEVNRTRMESLQVAAAALKRQGGEMSVVPSQLTPVLMRGSNADSQISAARTLSPSIALPRSAKGAGGAK